MRLDGRGLGFDGNVIVIDYRDERECHGGSRDGLPYGREVTFSPLSRELKRTGVTGVLDSRNSRETNSRERGKGG